MVGKEGGNIGEASAVACIYNEDEDEHKSDEKCLALAGLDSVGNDNECGEYDRKAEYDLVDGVSVLLEISPCAESESSACIEDR